MCGMSPNLTWSRTYAAIHWIEIGPFGFEILGCSHPLHWQDGGAIPRNGKTMHVLSAYHEYPDYSATLLIDSERECYSSLMLSHNLSRLPMFSS